MPCSWNIAPCHPSAQTTPEEPIASADALLSRIIGHTEVDELDYLQPDTAEKNPTAFASKLQVCTENHFMINHLYLCLHSFSYLFLFIRQHLITVKVLRYFFFQYCFSTDCSRSIQWQEELVYAAMRIEALKLAKQISNSPGSSLDYEVSHNAWSVIFVVHWLVCELI